MASSDFEPEELAMLRSFFRDEATETLEKLTARLLQVGAEHPGEDVLGELMRTTHTLKGSAGTVGLDRIVEFAHGLEDRFAQLRTGKLPWTTDALDCFVETVDALRAMVDDVEESSAQDILAQRMTVQLQALGELVREAQAGDSEPDIEPEAALDADDEDDGDTLDLDRIPALSDGTPTTIAHKGTHSVVAGGRTGPSEAPVEMTGPVSGRVVRVEANRIDDLMDGASELVFDRTRIERRVQKLRSVARDLGRMRQKARGQLASFRDAETRQQREAVVNTFRDLEAELARKVTELSRSTGALLQDTDALRHTTGTIQEGLTRMRMLSAGTLFQRIAPPLRSIARSAGKRIRLELSGEDTEFDKIVAEQIIDPLIQLLRNAVAHGIEPAEQRIGRGKAAEGRISIGARHAGGLVVLEVSDDGAGIDPNALRERFVAGGRWSKTRAKLATDDDVLRAIFDAGMSSRAEADHLAGRGVGLDAVRETISRLGGEIRVTSTPGKGTTFVMRLPVTTAVSQALLFKVRGHVYAIPNVHVLETTQLDVGLGQLPQTLHVRGDAVPVLPLHELLGTSFLFDLRSLPALVIEFSGRRFALPCDKIVGPRQIVVKDLGSLMSPLPLYAGATISGSGKVQLILDPAPLVRLAYPGAQAVETVAAPRVEADDADIVGRALVADDSRAIREAMTRILARAGYIVDVAEDGARAWAMVRELTYDVVLTDLEMPNLNGFQLIEKIRTDDQVRDTPIVIISSRASAANRRRARQLGVHSFVGKPVTWRKVSDALKRVR